MAHGFRAALVLHLGIGVLINLNLTKKHTEIGGFLIFLILYLAFFNIFFRFERAEYPVYAPGTLIFAFFGYWLGGYLYDKYLR